MSQPEDPAPEESSGSVVVTPGPARLTTIMGTVTAWQHYRWAPYWYDDAVNEAASQGLHARRREIVFSVSLAECYLFEFVLTQALAAMKTPFLEIERYFPPQSRRPITQKWKVVTRELWEDGKLAAQPKCAGPSWEAFIRLVKYRNALVHAAASRPRSSELRADQVPMLLTAGELEELPAGWAVGVVVTLIRELHKAAALPLPKWLS